MVAATIAASWILLRRFKGSFWKSPGVCCGAQLHIRTRLACSQEHTSYTDVVGQAAAELAGQLSGAVRVGVEPWRIVLDPGKGNSVRGWIALPSSSRLGHGRLAGLGFAKTQEGNEALVRGLGAFRQGFAAFGGLPRAPLLVGASRKGFLGAITGRREPAERDVATAAASAFSAAWGADVLRVHNVEAARDALLMADRLAPKAPL